MCVCTIHEVLRRTEPKLQVQQNSTNPNAGCPNRLGPSGKFVQNFAKITCLEIAVYRMKFDGFQNFKIRRGRKVQTQVHTVNSNSRPSDCQFSLFSKKNSIFRIFCIFGWLAIPINPDKWSCTAFLNQTIQIQPPTTLLRYGTGWTTGSFWI